MARKLVLVKSALECVHVYWLALAKALKSILGKIIQKCFKCLCTGKKANKAIHLVRWEKLDQPKLDWGWGLMNIHKFKIALVVKGLWRCLTDS